MTTIESLLDLYEALGGDADEISALNTIPELLEEISEVAGSTIELPGVTESDNGDVLTVVDGKWAKAEASTPTVNTIPFQKAGLIGAIKTYGGVSTILINTTVGTITSTSESLDFPPPLNLIYSSKISVPLYKDEVQVGYFTLTNTKISVVVDEDVTAETRHPVYANFTTL